MKSTIVLVLLVSLVAGCASVRQMTFDATVEHTENVKAAREITLECVTIWPFQAGLLEGLLGSRKHELPSEVVAALDQLNLLAEKQELTDYELGLFLGLQARLAGAVAQIVIEKYAPDVVGLVF